MGKVVVRGEKARQKAIELVRNGASYKEAAEATGFGENYVRQISVKAGASEKRNRSKASEKEQRQIILMSLAGFKPSEIAKELGYANQTAINNFLIKRGLSNIWKEVKWQSMKDYKAEGHSHKEVAEKYGVNKATSNNICKGIAPQQSIPLGHQNQYQTEEGRAMVLAKLKKQCLDKGFEYVSGYTGSEGHCLVKCLACGTVQDKACISIRQKYSLLSCVTCKEVAKKEREVRLEQERKEREARKAKKAEEAEKRKWFSLIPTQIEMKECERCGTLFVPTNRRMKFCSMACATAKCNSRHKDRRLKHMRERVVDKDIDLIKLAERDNNICWICGKEVDWNDFEYKDGYFIARNNYPSIDHVTALCEGGVHSWDNIRLAHRICNIIRYKERPAFEKTG